MAISDVIERLGRAIFEAPFAGGLAQETPELAEIRLAILDAAKAKGHRAGSRLVFPFNLVHVHLRGVPAGKAEIFRGEFLANYLTEELKRGLARSGHRFREDLRVEVSTTPELPLEGQSWLVVQTEIERMEDAQPSASTPRAAAKLILHLPKIMRSTGRSRASTPISCTIRKPANIASLMTAGTKGMHIAASGLYVTA